MGPPASLAHNINNPAASSNPPKTKNDSKTGNKDEPQKHMKLSLWDTAGQETYRSITRSYFRGASGALLVFDITRRNTFNSVTSWLHDLRQIAEDDIVIVLVGNKSDLAPSSTVSGSSSAPNKRQVTQDEAEEWCRQNKVMQYIETSAKSGENVERAFLDLNDRRSGVKGPGAGGGNARAVTLGKGDKNAAKKGGIAGGCC